MFDLADGGCYGAFCTMVNFYAAPGPDKVLLQRGCSCALEENMSVPALT